MRIRSIKPEFYRSDDIAALDIPTRLLFIGLWSYVDDHGRGRDNAQLIVADLFPLDNVRDSFENVSRGLSQLEKVGLIHRYEVSGKRYFHVVTWDKHQKVDKPQPSRFPSPDEAVTSDDEEPVLFANDRDQFANVREAVAPRSGSMEHGSGSMDQDEKTPSTPPASVSDRFKAFWDAYPRKVGKDDAFKAFGKAVKRAPFDEILAGISRYAVDPNLPDVEFIPHPATWLNGGRWADDPCPPKVSIMRKQTTTYSPAPGERKASY